MQRDSNDPTGSDDDRPTAASLHEGKTAGDSAMEDDLTEARYPTPAERSDAADETTMDP